ncbi:recombination regulator RecX [Listeria seeligeri]|uniref:recombination regulator RecX n=1 Tax=Listeria seeligeri TaxID=1640 RepID=UPI0010DDCDAC|nr:recombination regulator RecX [Listeria seeligeri]MBC1727419.1 recombination regulator RecX [Listeria seeligeri]MBC1732734.1 recombination regulator RecX [Listeria seeligeri]MBC1735544.1 recombination regulator RecX [Listeria seeligeri]MBC1765947.1 recombination regulator RecX [Listeria seeligeri]MBC1810465.1 recombination regulator RecX [Listeria seeligeri]
MKITSISVQQKNKERYNIFVDEKYNFSVDEEVLARFQLMKGKQLTEAEIEEIKQADMVRKGLNKAINFLSHRVRSEKEIRDYLRKQEMEPYAIDAILQKLADMDYINDAEFAELFTKTQIKTTLKGPRTIERELVEKGLTREIISQVILEYSEEAQIVNAEKQARKIMRRNNKSAKKTLQQKIITDLIQKGYTTEIAKLSATNVTSELDAADEVEILQKQLEKAIRKNKRYKPSIAKQKTITSLMQKGFSYDTIQSYLTENEISFEEEE